MRNKLKVEGAIVVNTAEELLKYAIFKQVPPKKPEHKKPKFTQMKEEPQIKIKEELQIKEEPRKFEFKKPDPIKKPVNQNFHFKPEPPVPVKKNEVQEVYLFESLSEVMDRCHKKNK